jgi:hypothetical protein
VTLLDDVLPGFEHCEHHRAYAAVPPQRALTAARAVTPAEVPLVRILFRLRGLGRAAGADAPLFDQLVALGFRILAENEREIVLGLVGTPWRLRGGLRHEVEFGAFDEPGYAKMAMSFAADGRELTTETRVLLTDAAARRRFRLYWLVVRPFSGLTRRLWLRAAGRRLQAVEASSSSASRR